MCCSLAPSFWLAAARKHLAAPVSSRTAAAPEDTYACVKKQLGALGYKQTSNDVADIGSLPTSSTRRPAAPTCNSAACWTNWMSDVSAESDGQTGIQVQGRTFAEYTTHRGPTEVEEKASARRSSADAGQLIERCRS